MKIRRQERRVVPCRGAGICRCEGLVILRVPDPRHAEVDCREHDRRQRLDLAVLEQAHVLEVVGLLDVADGVLDPPAGDVSLHDLPEGLARSCLREGGQQHHRLLPESPDDDHVQKPVGDVRKPHGHDAVQPRLEPGRRQHPAEPVLDLFRGGFLLERTDYGRELHVLLDHDSVDHVAYEAGDRLVEMGRNSPQKRFKLSEQFRRNCGIIHGVAFPCSCLALRIIPKIDRGGRRLS